MSGSLTPASTSSSRPSPTDLQSHLYDSFLHRKTADVALRVRGSWNAVYKLHRVVLIQAGFFQALFTSGFLESSSRLTSHRLGPEYIDIVFDDPNITRAGEQSLLMVPQRSDKACLAHPMWVRDPDTGSRMAGERSACFRSVGRGLQASTGRATRASPSASDAMCSARSARRSAHRIATLSASNKSRSSRQRLLLSVGSVISACAAGDASAEDVSLARRRQTCGVSFEICIARLYVGGPTLYLDPSLVPTPTQPLTSSFPYPAPASPCPADQHPATPRFLLSLLATAVFLSISSVASQALTEILRTVGPHTAVRYLEFAIGRGIGAPDVDEPEAAVGLEDVAELVKDDDASMITTTTAPADTDTAMHSADAPGELEIQKEDPAHACASPDLDDEARRVEPSYFYGGVSDKRMAAGWTPPATAHVQWAAEDQKEKENARWVRGLLASDALFVRGEKERYEMARRVAELRRAGGVLPDEERELEKLFAEGIYYANMHLDDLMTIAKDVSPTTGKPFVPLAVLQAAHWDHAVLYHRVTARPTGSASPPHSPASADKELGISITTAEIKSALQAGAGADVGERAYYPVPTDASLRIGDSTGIEGASMDQLFDGGASKKHTHTCEANFFGLQQGRRTGTAIADSAGAGRWTAHPPFRFAVEFWDVDALKEKSRLHSHTVWYAGSLYNIYVQIVRKKGIMLGVERRAAPHRARARARPACYIRIRVQSPPAPAPLRTWGAPMFAARAQRHVRVDTRHACPGPGMPLSTSLPSSGSGFAHSATNLHAPTPPPAVTLPATAPPVTPPQPYRDPRSAVRAYFTIACASVTGASLTRFSSAPDVFSVSQSWGWKSDSLKMEEYLKVDADRTAGAAGKEVSLRATVVLGVV
ncbi:hypothetical protein A0H81_00294 [Grifola frondosa]|uniref:BTB domain-containing protein n=1 Tax=Grifola frondosa TaxID=5627 RepID=A0A1C7MT35_GRIFR|nr:hypothetical protein A0H81_00294 [Grifola frondosa]